MTLIVIRRRGALAAATLSRAPPKKTQARLFAPPAELNVAVSRSSDVKLMEVTARRKIRRSDGVNTLP